LRVLPVWEIPGIRICGGFLKVFPAPSPSIRAFSPHPRGSSPVSQHPDHEWGSRRRHAWEFISYLHPDRVRIFPGSCTHSDRSKCCPFFAT
jgi:hypothetical protein